MRPVTRRTRAPRPSKAPRAPRLRPTRARRAVNGIDWSVGDAKTLLETEEAAMVELDTLLARVRSGSTACRAMIGQQEALQQELLRFPVQAA